MNDGKPDLNTFFPESVPDVKISPDLNNRTHGAHFDVMQAVEGGTDQIRVNPDGSVQGGTTNIGPAKLPWQ